MENLVLKKENFPTSDPPSQSPKILSKKNNVQNPPKNPIN